MGYYINSRGSDFTIKEADQPAALAAIKAAALKKAGRGKVKDHWAWIDMDTVQACKTLVDFLKEARWEPSVRGADRCRNTVGESEGDITALEFTGEKLGDEEEWMTVIAPYVQDGSYVEVSGEEDAFWRWVFMQGKLYTKDAVGIVWEDWEGIMRRAMTKNKDLIPSFLGLDPALDILLDGLLRGD